ncbi:MAG TPA: hypothetical protein VLU43_15635 [Anaeromyxobacteraceae bacterium]|nr:hypothetical protein [Anaeromyxobacteraceae bacterium]
MEAAVECTHCHVVMTGWSAPGSPIRYYQCPFCSRTHSSLYGEVFRRRAGARIVDAPVRATAPAQIPTARPEDVRWARVKQTAARWFARLEAEERRLGPPAAPARPIRPQRQPEVPEADPADVVELTAASARRR